MLFFRTPEGLNRVFSEDFGTMVDIKYEGDRKYAVQLPNGKQDRYRYDSGGMVELTSAAPIGKVVISLR